MASPLVSGQALAEVGTRGGKSFSGEIVPPPDNYGRGDDLYLSELLGFQCNKYYLGDLWEHRVKKKSAIERFVGLAFRSTIKCWTPISAWFL